MDIEELGHIRMDDGAPRLENPTVEDILSLVGVAPVGDATVKAALMKAMRTAAKKRLVGVTKYKRRGHYGHAASLALACVTVDESTASKTWLAKTCAEFCRYHALQREFDQGARWIARDLVRQETVDEPRTQ